MNHFCTIITSNYLPYAQQLFESISQNSSNHVNLHVFISDSAHRNDFSIHEENQNIRFYTRNEISSEIETALYQKYASTHIDAYRWSMKAVFMEHLLLKEDVNKLIFVDCDIHFMGNGDFLFDMLSESRFLITPHWRCASAPEKDPVNFQLNFSEGIYNAGFIGVNEEAIEILRFWANLCLAKCEKNAEKGFYVDQKYLDLLPSRFNGIKSLEHKGCNLAGWNIIECPRSVDDKGQLKIDGKFDPVFIHFTPGTIKEITSGSDPLLRPYFDQYNNLLRKYSEGLIDLNSVESEKSESKKDEKETPPRESIFLSLKRKIRLRTRVNAFLKG